MTQASSGLAWFFRRLRAMPLREIPHRLKQAWCRRTLLKRWPLHGPALPLDQWSWPELTAPNSHKSTPIPWTGPVTQGRTLLLFHHRKVDLGNPVNWQLDPDSGLNWPGSETPFHQVHYRGTEGLGDVKWVWEIGRLGQLLPMAITARASQSQDLALSVAQLVTDFWDQNPPGYGIHWTSGIEMAWRSVTMVWSLAMIRDLVGSHPDFHSAASAAWLHTLHSADFCKSFLSLHSSANNHLISEALVLELAASVCQEGEVFSGPWKHRLARWGQLGRSILDRELARQILPDGSGIERAPAYLVQVLEWALASSVLRQSSGYSVPEEVRKRLIASSQFLGNLCHGQERLPAVADSDDGSLFCPYDPLSPRHLHSLRAALQAYGDGGTPTVQGDLDCYLWSVGVSTSAGDLSGSREITTNSDSIPSSRSGNAGGLIILRRGPVRLVMDGGDHGQAPLYAHAHADALSLTLDWAGQPVLVDPGTYLYHAPGAWRDAFRSVRSHNTIQFQDLEPVAIQGPFLWDRPSTAPKIRELEEGVWETTYSWGQNTGFVHTRTLQWTGGERAKQTDSAVGCRVRDKVLATRSHQKAEAILRWHFAPGQITLSDSRGVWESRDQVLLAEVSWSITSVTGSQSIAIPRVVSGNLDSEPGGPLGWYSDRFGRKVPCPVIEIPVHFEGTTEIETIIHISKRNIEGQPREEKEGKF